MACVARNAAIRPSTSYASALSSISSSASLRPWNFSRKVHGQGWLVVYAVQTPQGGPKGFGSPPKKKEQPGKNLDNLSRPVREAEAEEDEEDEEDEVIPEVVTNRMLKRIAFTVGMPMAAGVLFFPLFYYLKVVRKVDVPEWLPLITSMVTFGSAGLGITYGVLSTSWDPLREGSLVGWKEAQLNWPAFQQTLLGKDGKSK